MMEFKVVARSKQRNGFGLFAYIVIDRMGRAFQVYKSDEFPMGHVLMITARDGEPDWNKHGFEAVSEKQPRMDPANCKKVWDNTDPVKVETKKRRAKKQAVPPGVDDFMRYENGEMSEDEMVSFFQKLIDTGMAWTLQGHYGRTAMQMINAGVCKEKRS